jgi:putative addiction module CopG family antidote
MAHVEKLSIALTPEMAAIVRQCVESGEYANSSEVIREALRDWKLKRSLQQNEIEESGRSGNSFIVARHSTVRCVWHKKHARPDY